MNESNLIPCSFEQLPTEILENIFAQLPLSELLQTYTTVCKFWSEVILNPSFLPWKKLYLSVKLERKTPMSSLLLDPARKNEHMIVHNLMKSLMKKHDFRSLDTVLLKLISFMGTVHRSPNRLSFDYCCEILKPHRLVKTACEYLHWLPDALTQRPFNIWHLTTTIILLSENVWDVHNLIHLLLAPASPFTATDVVEALYSLATILLQASRTLGLPIRYHYLVYYALYLFENTWQPHGEVNAPGHSGHSGQQSILNFVKPTAMRLTHEQAKIVNHNLSKTDVVKIVAFAGTGKTTTLLRFCRERPHLKFLLVVYNKSVQEFCKATFPSNTTVRTAHAMAFAQVGRRFTAIKRFESNLKPMKILEMLKSKTGSGHMYKRAGLVKVTLQKFFNSADPLITIRHVPTEDKNGVPLSDDYRLGVILNDSENVWNEMKLCKSTQRVNMTQDGQLKLWQLSKPKLKGFDVIMVDEGQDMNPTMFDVFLNQDAAKLIVGDPYQQIYEFRGATNALESIVATHTFYLTQSFRFGPEVAFVGHIILQRFLHVTTKTLVGGAIKDTLLADPRDRSCKMQRAYLCRTNMHLYKLALNNCKNEAFKDIKFAFAGGIDKVGLEDVMDIFKLAQIKSGFGTAETLQISNRLFSRFRSVGGLQKFADAIDDKELLNKIGMYLFSRENTPSDIALLRKRCSGETARADIVLSTIHKAKGLEWDWVILADDMLPEGLRAISSDFNNDLKAEMNLLYVAVTRAKRKLTINTPVLHALCFVREKLERLVPAAQMAATEHCLQCWALCQGDTDKQRTSPIITKVCSLPVSFDNYTFKGGYICDTCAALSIFELPQNPRQPINISAEAYVKDNERVARYQMITGEVIAPQSPLTHDLILQPIRWDKYHGNRF